jgi:hypothetical protein
MAVSPSKRVYQFKITLQDIKPPVWRRIQVLGDYTFWDLHVAIQDAMGWMDEHLHEFHTKNPRSGRGEDIGIPEDEPMGDYHPVLPGWKRRISKYFSPENPKAEYLYDFGDGWHHALVLEKILPAEEGVVYPRCLNGKRACPPEDCGGPWGYEDMLRVISDPTDKEHGRILEWLGGKFDPDDFDPMDVQFSDPAERWEIAFAEEDDFEDDEGSEDEQDDDGAYAFDHMKEIWEKAKANELGALSEEEQQLGRIMLEHKSVLLEDLESGDLKDDGEDDSEAEVNPFVHIMIHSIVENQLEEREPIEAFQFYNAMRKRDCSHHDAIHLIGAILVPLMFSVFEADNSFDVETYCELLRKYKTRNPEKIMRLLEKEPMLYDS